MFFISYGALYHGKSEHCSQAVTIPVLTLPHLIHLSAGQEGDFHLLIQCDVDVYLIKITTFSSAMEIADLLSS